MDQKYTARVYVWVDGFQEVHDLVYAAPSWPAAMAMANRDGHGERVISWETSPGCHVHMHDKTAADTEWTEVSA